MQLAWDKDADCLYVTHAYRRRAATPVEHAAALREWGEWLPFAWPHDGLQHSPGSGLPLADLYRGHGLRLLPEHAAFPDGSVGVEAGVIEMEERMRTGRWKIFAGCGEWLEEYRLYHRKDGRIVKMADDLLCASRYAMMMRRYAREEGGGWGKPIKYPPSGIV